MGFLQRLVGVLLALLAVVAVLATPRDTAVGAPGDPSVWTQDEWGVALAARAGAAMVHSPRRNHVVLFGGRNSANDLLRETWVWTADNRRWNQRHEQVAPTAREFASMALDPQMNVPVLFGGLTPTGPANDTWWWDGFRWHQELVVGTPPAPRYGAVFAADPVTGWLILFGGRDALGNPLGDTWAWDGDARRWRSLSPATAPAARAFAAAASSTDGIILFGGADNIGARDDTWRWDGMSWTSVSSATRPSPRAGAAFARHDGYGRLILFGGESVPCGSGAFAETWEFTANGWIELSPTAFPTSTSGPAGAVHASLTYDPDAGSLILVGGSSCGTPVASGTYLWSETAKPCPGTLVAYASGSDWTGKQCLEVIADPSPTPRGAVVFIHGGAWAGGSYNDWRDLATQLSGYTFSAPGGATYRLAAILVEYERRLSPPGCSGVNCGRWVQEPLDVANAVRWTQDSAGGGQWSIDPSLVAVLGDSAGGHLGLLAAMTDGGDTNPTPSVPFPPLVDSVRAAGAWSAPTDLAEMVRAFGCTNVDCPEQMLGGIATQQFVGMCYLEPSPIGQRFACPERYVRSSPLQHADASNAPTLLAHSRLDVLVPYQQAQLFAAERGSRNELITIDEWCHGLDPDRACHQVRPELWCETVAFLGREIAGLVTTDCAS